VIIAVGCQHLQWNKKAKNKESKVQGLEVISQAGVSLLLNNNFPLVFHSNYYYYYYYIRLMAFFQDNLGKPAPVR